MTAIKQHPIGIFDSGIGGLTVANAISKHLPNESIVYFGDTAHLPYGDKSPELIRKYAKGITNFLLYQKKCKAVVIACNTASAVAYTDLRDQYKGQYPIINVIDPIIEAIVLDKDIGNVGLIATKTTAESGVYQEKLARRKKNVRLFTQATPLLVPMIEEGFGRDRISSAIIERYLNHPNFKDLDALILGCTHYALIKDEINHFFDGRVKLFDSTDIVATKLHQILINESLLNNASSQRNYYVSDYTTSFAKTTKIFAGEDVPLKECNIWT